MYTTNLEGHSGCKILLCEENDNNIFVRKISGKADYNKRLILQAEKQKQFCSGVVKTPLVLDTGYTDDGLFYFDMEYIRGITLSKYIQTIEIGKVRGLVESIVQNIVSVKIIDPIADEDVFVSKIESLESNVSELNNAVINQALSILKKHSWKKFVRTSCHGDLTLENIIVKDNQLYYIDFLDLFYDSWIMDIATLMQDVQTLWAYRMQKEVDINTILRLIVFRDILIDEVKAIVGEDYIEVYYALLLKLIRIYPYTKDNATYKFLNNKTESIIRIIREVTE